MKVFDMLTVNRLIENLKTNEVHIDIPLEEYMVRLDFCGTYQVDRLTMYILKPDGSLLHQRIYVQDTLIYKMVADIHYLLLDQGIRIVPTHLMGDILSNSNLLNKDSDMSLLALKTLIADSIEPVTLNFADHDFVFSVKDAQLTYSVTDPNGDVKEYVCDDDTTIQSLSSILSDNTRWPTEDLQYHRCANIVSVHRALTKLLEVGANFVVDKDYLNLIKHIKNLDEPFTMEYGDELVTTFTYNDDTLHIKSRIPNQFVRTVHLGRDTTLSDIVNAIHTQYEEVPTAELLPNKLLIEDIIEELSSQV